MQLLSFFAIQVPLGDEDDQEMGMTCTFGNILLRVPQRQNQQEDGWMDGERESAHYLDTHIFN